MDGRIVESDSGSLITGAGDKIEDPKALVFGRFVRVADNRHSFKFHIAPRAIAPS